jgi:hypothetical protein
LTDEEFESELKRADDLVDAGTCSLVNISTGRLCNTSPAVAKVGWRCKNGCVGEGHMDMLCENCLDQRVSIEAWGSLLCRRCDQRSIEVFPVQRLHRV